MLILLLSPKVDLAWEVLMGDRYKELRSAIYATKAEKKRFRQVGSRGSFCVPIHCLLLIRLTTACASEVDCERYVAMVRAR